MVVACGEITMVCDDSVSTLWCVHVSTGPLIDDQGAIGPFTDLILLNTRIGS